MKNGWENYELDPSKFVSIAGLAWKAALKKTRVEWKLLTRIDMLLMIKKVIKVSICHSINRNAKVNKKYVNRYDTNKELSNLKYWDVKNFHGWKISQKLPLIDFKWVEDFSEFDECFIKSYNEEIDKGYFLEVGVNILKFLHGLLHLYDLLFLPERLKSLLFYYTIKLNTLFTSIKSYISLEKCSHCH